MVNSIALIICTYIVYTVSIRIIKKLKEILSEVKTIKNLLLSIELDSSDKTKPYVFEDPHHSCPDIDYDEFNFNEDTLKMQ